MSPMRNGAAHSDGTGDAGTPEAISRGSLPETLPGVLDLAWTMLTRGVADRRHGFHQPVLATVDADGLPDARTVVLRRAERDSGIICCHTDRRSPKVVQLGRCPRASWAFYDAGDRMQLRIAGVTAVEYPESSGDARAAWDRTGAQSRRCYLAPGGPSSPVDAPLPNLPPELLDRNPTREGAEEGANAFCVIVTRIERLEWLAIRATGHRRARFTWHADGTSEATWLLP